MSGSVNKVILVGRLGRDPESRSLNNGSKVVNFSLATDESWRDKASGDRKTVTEWHNVVVWNENIGKIVEQYCKKGSKVYLEGEIKTREYTDKDGNQRKSTEIVLNAFKGTLTLLDSKNDSDNRDRDDDNRGSRSDRGGSRRSDNNDRGSRRQTADLDDDIPF